jgi:hypothetical protein
MCGVDEDAGMLGSHNGIDHRGEVVDVREGFDAKDDIVERALSLRCRFFWNFDD